MEIVVHGDTDRRPVTYTLLKLLSNMADVALITNDRHYKRLIDGQEIGELESMLVSVGDYSVEEVFEAMEVSKEDFEYIVYDGILPESCDTFIHVAGCKMSEEEESNIEFYDDVITIPIGFGQKCIQYSVRMFQNLEEIEGYKTLKEVDPNLTKYIANEMASKLGIPAQTIRKVVARKR